MLDNPTCVEKKLEGQQVGECQCGRRRSTGDARTFSVRTEISELQILNIQNKFESERGSPFCTHALDTVTLSVEYV